MPLKFVPVQWLHGLSIGTGTILLASDMSNYADSSSKKRC